MAHKIDKAFTEELAKIAMQKEAGIYGTIAGTIGGGVLAGGMSALNQAADNPDISETGYDVARLGRAAAVGSIVGMGAGAITTADIPAITRKLSQKASAGAVHGAIVGAAEGVGRAIKTITGKVIDHLPLTHGV